MARLGKLTLASFLGSLLLPASLFALPPAPSIDEQLEKAGIRKGTALEQLVRENQSFGMLRAAERDSNSRVPAWLKVWYRKQNPHMEYNAADPTGGYPHVLKEILEWMVSHQDLRPGVNEPDVPPGYVNFPGGGIGRELTGPGEGEENESSLRESLASTVGTNVRASGAQTSRRSESDIRVNYWNTSKIIAGSNNIGGSGWQAQFYSTDGGTSWGQTTLPATSGDSFNSDPTVDWTSDGTAWATSMGITSGSQARMKLYRSTDSGASWAYHSTASGTQTNVDKQMMWVDHSATSPYKDRIYLIWHNGLPAFMNVFNGTSWGTPIQVSGSETTGTGIGADVKTNSFGDVFGAWPDTTSRGIYVVKSTNGGGSYGTPVRIRTTFGGYDMGVPAFNGRRILIYVSLGAYRTASKNNVYAVWTDFTGATGCTANANEPGSNVSSTCKTRIWFARSTDGGATFGAASMLNNQASLNDQFNPFVVVDETNGQLAVMYYDTVADAGRKKTHVYYQASFDDGASWSAATQVTTGQTDETGSGADTGNQYGDYNGLSGIAGTFFPSWTDRRNGTNEEIWSAKITEGTPPVTYTVSGNAGTTGATVSAGSLSATSDASSNYTLSGLVAGTYTVTPTKAGCTFTPTSQSVTVGPSATGKNFTASCSATTYSIAGNAGTTGATVTAGSASATSDASSNYTLPGLVAGTYTVTPSKAGCTFTPASQSVTVGPNATGKNFTASCTTGDTQLTSGVTVTGQSVALQQWKYYFITVPAGATNLTFTTTGATTDLDIYTQVTNKPTLSSYICRPYGATGNETCSATNPAAGTWWLGVYGYAAGSFSVNGTVTTAAATYSIAGSAGTTGATVTAGSASATSDASNNYTLSNLAAGTYTVTPSKSGCTFTPASQSVTVGPNATGKNFTASCTSNPQQLLVNPGFESGATTWVGTTGVVTNSTSRTPRTGSYYAWLNGNGTTTTETLYQTVTIPAAATTATLSFYLKIDTAETTTSTQYDKLQIQIRNSAGTVLATLATYSNLDKGTTYVQKSFNVAAYKGQTIRVHFNGTEDSSLQTSFLVDDTALNTQ